jgi:hypothetical protein
VDQDSVNTQASNVFAAMALSVIAIWNHVDWLSYAAVFMLGASLHNAAIVWLAK